MDMPDFQSVMLPLLRLAADGEEHVMAPGIAALADEFQLTAEQRAELLPGGGQRRFPNRVYWAAAHLRAAGLLASPTRGRFRITIASADTASLAVGRYVWDCRRTDAGNKATVADGSIDLRQEVTP